MSSCCLDNADLRFSELDNCLLLAASLKHTNLYGVSLHDAYLAGADVTEANFYSANARTRLDRVLGLTQEQLNQISDGYKSESLPPNMQAPSHWRSENSREQVSPRMVVRSHWQTTEALRLPSPFEEDDFWGE